MRLVLPLHKRAQAARRVALFHEFLKIHQRLVRLVLEGTRHKANRNRPRFIGRGRIAAIPPERGHKDGHDRYRAPEMLSIHEIAFVMEILTEDAPLRPESL